MTAENCKAELNRIRRRYAPRSRGRISRSLCPSVAPGHQKVGSELSVVESGDGNVDLVCKGVKKSPICPDCPIYYRNLR